MNIKEKQKILADRQAQRKDHMARIKRGVALLDALYGRENWLKRIKIKSFAISNYKTCVVGQAFKGNFEDFTDGVNNIDSGVSMGSFGFDYFHKVDWDLLQDLWFKKLTQLKKSV